MSMANPRCTHPLCSCKAYCRNPLENSTPRVPDIWPKENIAYKASEASLPSNPSNQVGGASLPTQEQIDAGPHAGLTIPEDYCEHADTWLSREQIKQEIRELDALRMEHASLYMDAIVYYRINELLDMLDATD